MNRLLIFIGMTIFGWVGWWIGAKVGFMTAFVLSMVGMGSGTILCFGFELGATGLWQGMILGPAVAIVMMAMRLQLRLREAEARLSAA